MHSKPDLAGKLSEKTFKDRHIVLCHNNIHTAVHWQKVKFESKTTPKPETGILLRQDTGTPKSPPCSHRKLQAQMLHGKMYCSFLTQDLEELLPLSESHHPLPNMAQAQSWSHLDLCSVRQSPPHMQPQLL